MKKYFDILEKELKIKVINKAPNCKYTTYMTPVKDPNPSNQTLYRGGVEFALKFNNKENGIVKCSGIVKRSLINSVYITNIKQAKDTELVLPLDGGECEIPFDCIANYYNA